MDTPLPQSSPFPNPLSYGPYYDAQSVVKVPVVPEVSQYKPQATDSQPLVTQPSLEKSPVPNESVETVPEEQVVPPPNPLPEPSRPVVPVPQQKAFPIKILIIALVVLVLLGGGGFVGMLFLKPQPPTVTPVVLPPTAQIPTVAPIASSSATSLTVTQPQNGDTISTQQIAISGKTAPYATVVLYTDRDQQEVKATESGDFNASVGLEKGINKVSVISIGKTPSPLVERYVLNE